jgi:hypothetical protein
LPVGIVGFIVLPWIFVEHEGRDTALLALLVYGVLFCLPSFIKDALAPRDTWVVCGMTLLGIGMMVAPAKAPLVCPELNVGSFLGGWGLLLGSAGALRARIGAPRPAHAV